jgi:hypothetical protein
MSSWKILFIVILSFVTDFYSQQPQREYLKKTKEEIIRQLGDPIVVDKMKNNFQWYPIPWITITFNKYDISEKALLMKFLDNKFKALSYIKNIKLAMAELNWNIYKETEKEIFFKSPDWGILRVAYLLFDTGRSVVIEEWMLK